MIFGFSTTYAAVVQSDANGNHSPEIQITPDRGVGGERWRNDLSPQQAITIGPGATADEHTALNRNFPGWIFNNGTGVSGELRIVHNDAFMSSVGGTPSCTLVAGGGRECFTVEYVNPAGNPVAPNNLRWLNLVCTDYPTGGATSCPPLNQIYVDPVPNDDTLPFYYTEGEHAIFSGAGDNPPLTFLDRPFRPLPTNRNPVQWNAHLYLVEWDGNNPGTVTIHNGTRWGFVLTCVKIEQDPDVYRRGGVFADKPTTEIGGTAPVGPPSEDCIIDPATFVTAMPTNSTFRLMDISPDETILYIADAGKNELVVVDATKGPSKFEVIKRIPVGTDPRDVAVTPDGKKVYVTNHFDGTVSAVDTSTYTVTKTIPVDHLPWGIDVSSDGEVIVVANWGGKGKVTNDDEKGTLSIISTQTDQVIQTVDIPSTDVGGPWGVNSHPDQEWFAITNDGTNSLILLHKETFEIKIIDLAELGCLKPWDVEVTEDGKVIPACGDGTNFFPVIFVACPDEFRSFSQCEIDTSQRLEFEGISAVNEPWAVYSKNDLIYGVDMYNVALEGVEQEEGTLLVWDEDSLRLIEKIEHEDYPEIVGIAPRDVLVLSDGTLFVSNSGTHKISDKQSELDGVAFSYPTPTDDKPKEPSTEPPKPEIPVWVWIAVGIAIAIGIVVGIYFSRRK